jgi:glycosyltransferase involved in cell wall biosynthesis
MINDNTINYKNQKVFVFALPIQPWLNKLNQIKKEAAEVVCMCVCETESVHPVHEELFNMFETILVPSEFCKKVFSRQFPSTNFEVVRHWDPLPPPCPNPRVGAPKYVFYHIGNVIDHRKQVNKILQAFEELNLPNSQLVLKASCNKNVKVNTPNVLVINGLLPKEQIDSIHNMCDCYVSFSHSEGVGMGAVEAALRNKPVIITEYGGASEYIKTDFTIKCGLTPVGLDDFLYTKDMLWGDPSYDELKTFMKKAYDEKLRYMNHEHTRILLDSKVIRNQLLSWLKEPTDPQ